MKKRVKNWGELNTDELYSLLQLRQEVFIIEQNCVYQDLDQHDTNSIHILGYSDTTLVAYSRVLPPNELYAQASIGRVAISKEHRGKNLGRELMDYTLELCGELFGKDAQIKIMAQYYLVPFYESLGFEVISNKFWDDEIAHYYMLKRSLES